MEGGEVLRGHRCSAGEATRHIKKWCQDEYKSLSELGIDLKGEMGYVLSDPGAEYAYLSVAFEEASKLRMSKEEAVQLFDLALEELRAMTKMVASTASLEDVHA